jgi:hypothetical protein
MSVKFGTYNISDSLVLLLNTSNPLNYTLSEVEVMVVAGGGGGGRYGGGGGAGGLVYNPSYKVTPGTPISVTVGNGGAGHPGDAQNGGTASNGQNSIFGVLTAIGGGGAGNYNNGGATNAQSGASGGSGGGSGTNGPGRQSEQSPGGAGTTGQGFSGGYQSTGYGTGGGGGGGAGGDGYNGLVGGPGGQGGIGLPFDIAGTLNYYAGGGGGGGSQGWDANTRVKGGLGGGGTGIAPSAPLTYIADAINGTGGGGGGGSDNTIRGSARAGNGGSGIVIVRYPGPRKATGGNISFINGYTIHIFSSGGTFTPLSVPSNGGSINGLQDFSGNNNHLIARSNLPNQYLQPGSTPEGYVGNNTVTFAVQGSGTWIRQGHGQVFGDYTIKPQDAVYRYDLGSDGCHYHGNDVTVSSGTFATFTFDYYISADALNFPSTNLLGNFEGVVSNSAGAPNSLLNTWQTVSFTGGPTGTGGLRMLLYPGACGPRLADYGFILYRNPRVELHTTSNQIVPTYTSSDRSVAFDGTFGYLVRNNFPFPTDNFTVSLWVKTTSTTKGVISYASSSSDNEFLIYDNAIYLRSSSVGLGFSYNNNAWNYVTVTRDLSGTVLTYLNGVFSSTLTLPSGSLTTGGSLVIGGEQDAVGQGEYGGGLDQAQQFAGNIGGIEIYSRILNSTEILNNYNTQKSKFGL